MLQRIFEISVISSSLDGIKYFFRLSGEQMTPSILVEPKVWINYTVKKIYVIYLAYFTYHIIMLGSNANILLYVKNENKI